MITGGAPQLTHALDARTFLFGSGPIELRLEIQRPVISAVKFADLAFFNLFLSGSDFVKIVFVRESYDAFVVIARFGNLYKLVQITNTHEEGRSP